MILDLTDEQKAFQSEVAAFAADRVAPQAAAIDERGAFPRELVREAAALGLLGVTIAAAWGGGGRGLRQLRAGARGARAGERGRGGHRRGQQLARRRAARAIRHRRAEADLAAPARDAAQSLGAFALSEEHAGSDAANQQTVARLDDRGYVHQRPQGLGRQRRGGRPR